MISLLLMTLPIPALFLTVILVAFLLDSIAKEKIVVFSRWTDSASGRPVHITFVGYSRGDSNCPAYRVLSGHHDTDLGVDQSTPLQVLNHLQAMLDFHGDRLHPQIRRWVIHQLSTIVSRDDILPTTLECRPLDRFGQFPAGGGGFSDVWRALWNQKRVAVKVLRCFGTSATERDRVWKSCKKEAIVWRQLHHDNILPLLGVNSTFSPGTFCLVSPWLGNGNIMRFIETYPAYPRINAIHDILAGLKYLHGLVPAVVHADIRGSNILVKDNGHCCLSDFGLTILSETVATLHSTVRGSLRWLPPEAVLDTPGPQDSYRPPRDIYSFACTVVEIYSGKRPFDLKTDAQVVMAIHNDERPARPSVETGMSDALWSLIDSCFDPDPSARPSASRLLEDCTAVCPPVVPRNPPVVPGNPRVHRRR
ncbi:kinase-like protein [Cylindrobasidium torrendii FP15055 ss-10]|uniref:Kinase-like protein n=1 Tax=Cylindrobasidium torrendii FP15055 ss-10 TaxID=1314674 RepID=A0A0D7B9N0_9AGAR|nr:kinase-like protein [Cylindrobasidium torrendii FP15055 ss-10]